MAIIQMDYYSKACENNKHMEFIVPGYDGWEQTPEPYRVLYVIPEGGMGANETVCLMSLRRWAMMTGIAVIVVDPEDYIKPGENQKLIWKEMLAVSREMFPLSRKREDTYLWIRDQEAQAIYDSGSMELSAFSKWIAPDVRSENANVLSRINQIEMQLESVFAFLMN